MVNRQNYLWIKQFIEYLQEVKNIKDDSLGRYWFYLRHLLLWADETLLSDAMTVNSLLQTYVRNIPGKSNNQYLSVDTQKKIFDTSRRFFNWAKINRSSEFRKLPVTWIDELQLHKKYFNKSDHIYVSLDEVLQLARIEIDPQDIALQRDQAAASMLYLSGMRATAFTTAPVGAFDINNRCVYQWPKEYGVLTKNDKKATTFLLPIPELIEVVMRWDNLVRRNLPLTSRWYAPIKSEWGDQEISTAPPGKNRNHALNKRLRILFKITGLSYKSAHKFRHGNAVYGLQHAQTMADYKAVSMNLMHEDIRTTDSIYAPLISAEISNRIARLKPTEIQNSDGDVGDYIRNLTKSELAIALNTISEMINM